MCETTFVGSLSTGAHHTDLWRHKCTQSAWKRLFFFDCFGIGRIMGNRSESSKCSDSACTECANRIQLTEKHQQQTTTDSILVGNKNSRQTSKHNKPKAHCGSSSCTKMGTQNRCTRKWLSNKRAGLLSKPAVRSPTNKALIQSDPLFHLYLICVGLITLSILAIKCLIPGMPIYSHTVIGFAFLLAIILVSTIYAQFKSKKINIQFRILLWLIISVSLTLLQLVDLIVPDEMDSLNLQSISDVSQADSLSCAFAWYYTFTIIIAMTTTSIFIRINVWLKFMLHISTIIFYIVINNPPATMMDMLKEFLQSNNWSLLDHKQELSHLFYISMIAVILHLIDRQVEYILSLNIQWNEQIESDRIDSVTVGEINRILLENILPPHVLKRYLYNTTVSYDQLYHESSCSLLYRIMKCAYITESFYTENSLNEQGLRCLQVLNEIICDFDQLLSHPAFRNIEKIKTIGSTYMAACFDVARRTSDCTTDGPETAQSPDIGHKGVCLNSADSNLNSGANNAATGSLPRVLSSPQSGANQFRGTTTTATITNSNKNQSLNQSAMHLDELAINNVVTIVCFATALMENLDRMNKAHKDSWQEFRLRIGIAIGPVIAGVVGASKPTYDIWGDTVNVASRLESSGVLGRIQVSEQVAQILTEHGQFEVECRGPIEVKGKGQLITYLVVTPFDSAPDSPSIKQTKKAAANICAGGAQLADVNVNRIEPADELDETAPRENGEFVAANHDDTNDNNNENEDDKTKEESG